MAQRYDYKNKNHIFKPPCNMFFLLYRHKDINKIIDFYLPKSNCDGSNLQYSNMTLVTIILRNNTELNRALQ